MIDLNEYVIGYKHNHNIKPLYIKLPEYVCSGSTFKENITISSEINDADFFEKYNKIWKKIEELIGINFERKPQVHSSTNLSSTFFYIYNFHNLNTHQNHMIYHIYTQLLGFQAYPLSHAPLSINYLHSHLHLSLFQCCLLLQAIESNLHSHLHLSHHFMCLVALVLDIRLIEYFNV